MATRAWARRKPWRSTGSSGRVGGDGLGEQLLGGGDEPLVELETGLGVELTVEAPHAVAIDPGAHPAGSPLAFQPGHPTVGLQLADLGAQLTAQLLRGERRGAPGDPRPLGRQHVATAGSTRPQHVADHVDMTGRHRPRRQRGAQLGHPVGRRDPLDHPVHVPRGGAGPARANACSAHESIAVKRGAIRTSRPSSHARTRADDDGRRGQRRGVVAGVIERGELPDQLDHRLDIHTNKCTEGCHTVPGPVVDS